MQGDLDLTGKNVALDAALAAAGISHAFGGALTLAYHDEPLATQDIDVNLFVDTGGTGCVEVTLRSMMDAPVVIDGDAVERDGQTRCWWGHTPLDLFFSYDPLHDAMKQRCRDVQFGSGVIPILSLEHLVICKVAFDRPKDWVDIETMKAAGTNVDIAECRRWLSRILEANDPRIERLQAIISG